jgi:hypothetical protein
VFLEGVIVNITPPWIRVPLGKRPLLSKKPPCITDDHVRTTSSMPNDLLNAFFMHGAMPWIELKLACNLFCTFFFYVLLIPDIFSNCFCWSFFYFSKCLSNQSIGYTSLIHISLCWMSAPLCPVLRIRTILVRVRSDFWKRLIFVLYPYPDLYKCSANFLLEIFLEGNMLKKLYLWTKKLSNRDPRSFHGFNIHQKGWGIAIY